MTSENAEEDSLGVYLRKKKAVDRTGEAEVV